ncbi:MAG TPA: formylmethanofuran dehydrogenase subunit B, partial [Candidatus Nanoarchaeia archaeon]|nr:formylmethanofuran dehydrogenase subunit B [Candidatus Nanoarchaeia archaeon]
MIIKDVLCPFCGCLCDDLAVEVENNKVVDVQHACKIGSSKIMGHDRI